jgi:simple sugar transport system permease protein
MRDRTFTENMTDGVGFLALAMVIFGRWHAGGIVAAGLFFGLVRALANHLQTRTGIGVPGLASTIELSPARLQLIQMLPYVVSLLALAGVGGRSGAPAALGRPYVREG